MVRWLGEFIVTRWIKAPNMVCGLLRVHKLILQHFVCLYDGVTFSYECIHFFMDFNTV